MYLFEGLWSHSYGKIYVKMNIFFSSILQVFAQIVLALEIALHPSSACAVTLQGDRRNYIADRQERVHFHVPRLALQTLCRTPKFALLLE